MNRIIIIFAALVLTGCSAFLVPNSSDPYKKLAQAAELYQAGRPLPSERIAKEALQTFVEQKDKFGQSEANFFLGIFYKSKSGWENAPAEKYLDKAIGRLKLAKSGYESIGENIQASKAAFEIGQSYRGKGRTDITCQYYEESLELYKTGQGEHKRFSFNPIFKSPLDLFTIHIEQVCAKNA